MNIRDVQPLNENIAKCMASLAGIMSPLSGCLTSSDFGEACFNGYSDVAHGVLSCCSFGLTFNVKLSMVLGNQGDESSAL